jgi:hypothetical protein
MSNAYEVLVGKPERKNHLEDFVVDGMIVTIKMDLTETGWKGVHWI